MNRYKKIDLSKCHQIIDNLQKVDHFEGQANPYSFERLCDFSFFIIQP